MPHRSRPDARAGRELEPHEVLGLSPREEDAVRVIEVAHLLLRQWRRLPLADPARQHDREAAEARERIRQIVAARQAMLDKIRIRFHAR